MANERLLESGAFRLIETGATRTTEDLTLPPPPPDPPPAITVRRLLENTTDRLIESGEVRLLEAVVVVDPSDPDQVYRPFRFVLGSAADDAGSVELVDFDAVTLKGSESKGWEASFNMPGSTVAATVVWELATDLWVYLNAEPFERARIVNVGETWGVDGEPQLAVTAHSYLRVLARRMLWTDLTLTNDPQGDIAWALIEHTQAQTNGDLGITAGTLDASVNRDRTYLRGANIGALLQQLSEVIDGPWYVLGPDRVFHAYAQSERPVQPQPVLLGTTARTLQRTSGAARYANAVQGFGDAEQTTPASAFTADLATDVRGRWEAGASWSSVIDQTTLEEHTDGFLQSSVTPLRVWTATLDPSRWLSDLRVLPGDLVTIVQPRSRASTVGVPTVSVEAIASEVSFTVTRDGQLSDVACTFREIAL